MKRLANSTSLAILAVFLIGCASIVSKDIGYSLPNGKRANLRIPYNLVVMKFTDIRPKSERISQTPIGGTKSGDNWFKGSLSDEISKKTFLSHCNNNSLKNTEQTKMNFPFFVGKNHSMIM